MQATFGLRAAMALRAFAFEYRLNVLEVVDAAFVRILRLHAVDLRGDKRINAPFARRIFCQPCFCSLVARGPVRRGQPTQLGALLGVHLCVVRVALLLIGGPAGIVVWNLAFARSD